MIETASLKIREESPAAIATVDDRVLVRQAQGGDYSAFDTLVQKYQERVYATIYHMTSNHEDANDLTQETFIKAYKAVNSFKGDSSFFTWVYRIAVNKTINFLKGRKNKIHLSLNDLDFNGFRSPRLGGSGGIFTLTIYYRA